MFFVFNSYSHQFKIMAKIICAKKIQDPIKVGFRRKGKYNIIIIIIYERSGFPHILRGPIMKNTTSYKFNI